MPRTTTAPKLATTTGALLVPVDHIDEGGFSLRETYDDGELRELADSIREHGILQNLVLAAPTGEITATTRFQVLAGHRRLRAAKLAGLETVPAVVVPPQTPDWLQRLIALDENLQRAALSNEELGKALIDMVQSRKLSRSEIAAKLHKTEAWLSQNLAALQDEDAAKLLFEGKATYRSALEIARTSDPEVKKEMVSALERGETISSRELRARRRLHHEPSARVASETWDGTDHKPLNRAAPELATRSHLLTMYREVTEQIVSHAEWSDDEKADLKATAVRMIAFAA